MPTMFCWVFVVFLLLVINHSTFARMVPNDEDGEEDRPEVKKRVVNFAAVSAGAVVLESSAQSTKFQNLLNDDKDKYGMTQCSEKKWVVLGLSEDILIEYIVMINYERYSSTLANFQVLGSTSYPVSEWMDLGTFSATPELGEQTFVLPNPSWGRYLKFRFLTHHGNEFYCTLSQIKVHGSTVIENLQKEVDRSTQEVLHLDRVMQEQEQDSDAANEEELLTLASGDFDIDLDVNVEVDVDADVYIPLDGNGVVLDAHSGEEETLEQKEDINSDGDAVADIVTVDLEPPSTLSDTEDERVETQVTGVTNNVTHEEAEEVHSSTIHNDEEVEVSAEATTQQQQQQEQQEQQQDQSTSADDTTSTDDTTSSDDSALDQILNNNNDNDNDENNEISNENENNENAVDDNNVESGDGGSEIKDRGSEKNPSTDSDASRVDASRVGGITDTDTGTVAGVESTVQLGQDAVTDVEMDENHDALLVNTPTEDTDTQESMALTSDDELKTEATLDSAVLSIEDIDNANTAASISTNGNDIAGVSDTSMTGENKETFQETTRDNLVDHISVIEDEINTLDFAKANDDGVITPEYQLDGDTGEVTETKDSAVSSDGQEEGTYRDDDTHLFNAQDIGAEKDSILRRKEEEKQNIMVSDQKGSKDSITVSQEEVDLPKHPEDDPVVIGETTTSRSSSSSTSLIMETHTQDLSLQSEETVHETENSCGPIGELDSSLNNIKDRNSDTNDQNDYDADPCVSNHDVQTEAKYTSDTNMEGCLSEDVCDKAETETGSVLNSGIQENVSSKDGVGSGDTVIPLTTTSTSFVAAKHEHVDKEQRLAVPDDDVEDKSDLVHTSLSKSVQEECAPRQGTTMTSEDITDVEINEDDRKKDIDNDTMKSKSDQKITALDEEGSNPGERTENTTRLKPEEGSDTSTSQLNQEPVTSTPSSDAGTLLLEATSADGLATETEDETKGHATVGESTDVKKPVVEQAERISINGVAKEGGVDNASVSDEKDTKSKTDGEGDEDEDGNGANASSEQSDLSMKNDANTTDSAISSTNNTTEVTNSASPSALTTDSPPGVDSIAPSPAPQAPSPPTSQPIFSVAKEFLNIDSLSKRKDNGVEDNENSDHMDSLKEDFNISNTTTNVSSVTTGALDDGTAFPLNGTAVLSGNALKKNTETSGDQTADSDSVLSSNNESGPASTDVNSTVSSAISKLPDQEGNSANTTSIDSTSDVFVNVSAVSQYANNSNGSDDASSTLSTEVTAASANENSDSGTKVNAPKAVEQASHVNSTGNNTPSVSLQDNASSSTLDSSTPSQDTTLSASTASVSVTAAVNNTNTDITHTTPASNTTVPSTGSLPTNASTNTIANTSTNTTSNVPQSYNSSEGVGQEGSTPSFISSRIRSTATCLDALKFADFQAKMKAKLDTAGSNAAGAAGSGAAGAAVGNLPLGSGGSLPPGGSPDVFRSLMQKIISLEQKSRIFELYTAQINECYQTFFREMEMENNRQEKHAQQRTLLEEEKSSKQKSELIDLMQDLVLKETSRVLHSQGLSVDGSGVTEEGTQRGRDGCIDTDIDTGDCLVSVIAGESSNTSVTAAATTAGGRGGSNNHVNIGSWLENRDNCGWISRVLDIFLPTFLGTEYVQSNVPIADLLMYSIGLCLALFFLLFILILLCSVKILLK